MSQINYIKIGLKEEDRWNTLLKRSLHGSYRSSISYEYSRRGDISERSSFIFVRDDVDVAGVHYSIKESHKGLIRIADISSGIVFLNLPDEALVSFILKHFLSWASDRQACFARISSWLPAEIDTRQTDCNDILGGILTKYDFHTLNEGRHTYWLDLTMAEEDLLGRMEKQTRKRIRQGSRSVLKVEKIEDYSDKDFTIFWSLYSNLGEEKNFNTGSKSGMKREVSSLMKNKLANMYFTSYKGEVVYCALTSTFGDSATLYSALRKDYNNISGCPTPGQYAYWEMIKSVKEMRLQIYDFGFCPGPVPVKTHPAYGIWRFKYDFGGNHVQFMPVYGKVLKPIAGRLFSIYKYRKFK